jgi:hypothetical protein
MPFGVFAWLELHKAKYPKNTNTEHAINGKRTNIISHLLSDCGFYLLFYFVFLSFISIHELNVITQDIINIG